MDAGYLLNLVNPRDSLDVLENRTIFAPARIRTPFFPVVKLVA
jgi:hypothetical protein